MALRTTSSAGEDLPSGGHEEKRARTTTAHSRPSTFFVGAVADCQTDSTNDHAYTPRRTKTSRLSTPCQTDPLIESSSNRDGSSQASPVSQPARLVQLALDLSANRKRHAGATRVPSMNTPTPRKEQESHVVSGTLDETRRQTQWPGLNAPGVTGYLDAASPSTLYRVAKARSLFELSREYRRLLEVIPAAYLDQESKKQLQINPLQTIRNRKARSMKGLKMLQDADRWHDIDAVRSWVDSVIIQASTSTDFGRIPLNAVQSQRPDENSISQALPDGPSYQQRGQDAYAATYLQNAWSVEPSELLADLHWTIQSLNETSSANSNQNDLAPFDAKQQHTEHTVLQQEAWLTTDDADCRLSQRQRSPDGSVDHRRTTATIISRVSSPAHERIESCDRGIDISANRESTTTQVNGAQRGNGEIGTQPEPLQHVHSLTAQQPAKPLMSDSSLSRPLHSVDTTEDQSRTHRARSPQKTHVKSSSLQLKTRLHRLPGIQLLGKDRNGLPDHRRLQQDDAQPLDSTLELAQCDPTHELTTEHASSNPNSSHHRRMSDDKNFLSHGGRMSPALSAEVREGKSIGSSYDLHKDEFSPKSSVEETQFHSRHPLDRGLYRSSSRSSASIDSLSTSSIDQWHGVNNFTTHQQGSLNPHPSHEKQYHIPNLPIFQSQSHKVHGTWATTDHADKVLAVHQNGTASADGNRIVEQLHRQSKVGVSVGAMSPIDERVKKGIDHSSPGAIDHWEQSRSSKGNGCLALSLQDIARVRTMLLSSGIKAREIVRRESIIASSSPKSLQHESGEPKMSCPKTALLFTSLPLCDEMDHALRQAEDAIYQFNVRIRNVLATKVDAVRQKASDRLITTVQDVSNDADAFTVELTTRPPRDIKRIDDAIDNMIKRQRRQWRLFRRTGFKLLEWAVLSIMWCIWLFVVLFRLGRGFVVGLCKFVKWLVWF